MAYTKKKPTQVATDAVITPTGQKINQDSAGTYRTDLSAKSNTPGSSRPIGAPVSESVDLTHFTPEERDKISLDNALKGIAREKIAKEKLLSEDAALQESKTPEGQDKSKLATEQGQERANLLNEDLTALRPPGQEQTQQPQEQSLLQKSIDGFDNGFGQQNKLGNPLIKPATDLGAAAAVGSVVTAPVFGGIGKASIGIAALAGYSLNSVIGLLTSGKEGELEGDITDTAASSKIIASDVSKGADPIQALDALDQMEEEVRAKIGELNVAIERNPKDTLKAKDSQEFARRKLLEIQSRKFAVQRYLIDGNAQALQQSVGIDITTG